MFLCAEGGGGAWVCVSWGVRARTNAILRVRVDARACRPVADVGGRAVEALADFTDAAASVMWPVDNF